MIALLLLFISYTQSKSVIGTYISIFDEGYDRIMQVKDFIPWKTFDRLYIAFATLDDNYNMTDIPDAEYKIKNITYLYRKANPNGKIYISSDYGGDMDHKYSMAARNPESFALSVVKYMEKYKLDGYDIDWETAAIDWYVDDLVKLLTGCKKVFGSKYGLTNTVWVGVASDQTVCKVKDVLDGINIMSYGSDYNSIVSIINGYNACSFPYDKMIVGIESEVGADTKLTTIQKIDAMRKFDLGGIFYWRIDNDYVVNGIPTFQMAKWINETLNQ